MASTVYTDVTLYRRLLRQARPYWPYIGGIFLLSLLSSPLSLLTPLPLKIAVDSVIGSHPLPGFFDVLLPAAITGSDGAALLIAAGLLVAVSLLSQLQELATSLLRTYAGERLVLGFRAQLFRHLQRLSLTYSDSKGTSDSSYRIQYDAPAIQFIAIDGVIPFFSAGLTIARKLGPVGGTGSAGRHPRGEGVRTGGARTGALRPPLKRRHAGAYPSRLG